MFELVLPWLQLDGFLDRFFVFLSQLHPFCVTVSMFSDAAASSPLMLDVKQTLSRGQQVQPDPPTVLIPDQETAKPRVRTWKQFILPVHKRIKV